MRPVPVVEGPGDRRVLLDAAGAPIGRYDHDERHGVVYADLFLREPGVSAERAAATVLADLKGMRIAGDEALGRALIAAGLEPRDDHGGYLVADAPADLVGEIASLAGVALSELATHESTLEDVFLELTEGAQR
jgi:hypothetical protein